MNSTIEPSGAGGGILLLGIMLFFVVLGIALLAFWIWMLIDCAVNESSEGNDKIVWILIIVFLQAIGALIYFFARRPKRINEQRARGVG